MFIGFNMTFLVQHWLGVIGLPRRTANYPLCRTYATTLNQISTVGAFILGVSNLFFFYNVYKTWKHGERVVADDPWGFGNSLEWATSCPPPRHNFTSIPRIRSERPAFDLHHPHVRAGRDPRSGRRSGRVTDGHGDHGERYRHEGRRLAVPRLRDLLRRRRRLLLELLPRPDRTTALALAVGLAFLTGFYVLFTGRRLPRRPEDDNEGEIEQGTGELGFFSPHSWWPLFVGLAAATAALGVAVGWWLFLIGMLFTVLSAIGFVFEYYRGVYAH